MVLAYLATEYPDELETDFWRSYGCSWRDMPLWRAAVLASPLATRPECETCRAIDPQWWWRDPLFSVVAAVVGLKPEKQDGPQQVGHGRGRGAVPVSREQAERFLHAPRRPFEGEQKTSKK
ncbi:MAG: hypothetical protein SPH31_05845 [Arcanobacterium sp.]|nr:hypothetical protein [Arcanobacterium sp.]